MAALISLADQVKTWAKRQEAIVKLAAELERLPSPPLTGGDKREGDGLLKFL